MSITNQWAMVFQIVVGDPWLVFLWFATGGLLGCLLWVFSKLRGY